MKLLIKSELGDSQPISLEDFLAANQESLSAEEVTAISKLNRGESIEIGGGAGVQFTITCTHKGFTPAEIRAMAIQLIRFAEGHDADAELFLLVNCPQKTSDPELPLLVDSTYHDGKNDYFYFDTMGQ